MVVLTSTSVTPNGCIRKTFEINRYLHFANVSLLQIFVTVNITQEIQSTFYKYIYINASLQTLAAPFLKRMYIYTHNT